MQLMSNVRRQQTHHSAWAYMNTASAALFKAALLGLAVLMLSAVVSFVAHSGGVRMNTDAWPPEARSILTEAPGQPITAEQWRRIEKELQAHGGDAKPSHLLAGEVRQTWPVFVVLALLALLLVRRFRPLNSLAAGVAVVTPSLLVVLAAFVHSHPYYR